MRDIRRYEQKSHTEHVTLLVPSVARVSLWFLVPWSHVLYLPMDFTDASFRVGVETVRSLQLDGLLGKNMHGSLQFVTKQGSLSNISNR